MAPRPHTSPSISSPPNGSRDQPSGLTGTTSVWPIRHSVGASGSLPSMRATIDVRPGRLSKRSTSSPAPSRYVCSRSALRTSSPESGVPSLTHWLRISACSSSVVGPVADSAVIMSEPHVLGDAEHVPSRRRSRTMHDGVVALADPAQSSRAGARPKPTRSSCSTLGSDTSSRIAAASRSGGGSRRPVDDEPPSPPCSSATNDRASGRECRWRTLRAVVVEVVDQLKPTGVSSPSTTRAPSSSWSCCSPSRSMPLRSRNSLQLDRRPRDPRRGGTWSRARRCASRPGSSHISATMRRLNVSGSIFSLSTKIGPSTERSSSASPVGACSAKNARCVFENSLRSGSSPLDRSRHGRRAAACPSARPSTRSRPAGRRPRRSKLGQPCAARPAARPGRPARSLITESSARPWIRRGSATTPALFRPSCGVSKKKTWRIWRVERIDAERRRRRAVRALGQRRA